MTMKMKIQRSMSNQISKEISMAIAMTKIETTTQMIIILQVAQMKNKMTIIMIPKWLIILAINVSIVHTIMIGIRIQVVKYVFLYMSSLFYTLWWVLWL